MSRVFRTVLVVLALAVVPSLGAAELEADTNGPWINVDVIDLNEYGDASYLDYLGRGYVAMLDALKKEGTILDYGVMMKTTGNASDGDVVVWWSVETLADYEKAGDRMGAMASELNSPEEWQEIWTEVQKLRTVRSSNLYRAVLWSAPEE